MKRHHSTSPMTSAVEIAPDPDCRTGSILAVLCPVTVLPGSAERGAARKRPSRQIGQFIDVDGHRVHAVSKGSGPDLVLIHGSSGNTRDIYPFAGASVDP